MILSKNIKKKGLNFMKIKEIKEKIRSGIDKIGFAMPKYFLDIRDLALGRNENENKFVKGLMQSEMSISPVTEDIVSLGASAAAQILDEKDKKNIDMVIVGTESGVDQSKASAVFIHHLLNIQPFARCIEIKEACYGATAALSFAKNYIEKNNDASCNCFRYCKRGNGQSRGSDTRCRKSSNVNKKRSSNRRNK